MIIAFYIVAGLTALAFLAFGLMKLARPKAALKQSGLVWVDDFSSTSVKLIGLAEVLGAVGLILPMATGIAPILSPIAGLCLAVVMIGAVIVHVRRKETPLPAVILVLLPLAAAILGFLAL
ncbi:DoxX family protein [Herbiconiux sp. P15]|uniref:DoxX family protein n=1 Tax=Herbiconiux liukaitaii TaxID=3342799 RepID=UPI0035B9DC3D